MVSTFVITVGLSTARPAYGDEGFRLPWTSGDSHVMVQGWKQGSHSSVQEQFAYDFQMNDYTPIRAAQAGTVAYRVWDKAPDDCGSTSDYLNGHANYVTLNHSDGTATLYLHLSKVADKVIAREPVARGEIIGWSGHTGYSYPACYPHLHFQRQAQGAWITNSKQVYFDEYPGQELQNGLSYRSANAPPPPSSTTMYNINLFVNGPGSVSSSPAGLSAGHNGGTNHAYPAGTQITLTASPDSGATFTRWGGACDGSSSPTCVFTVNAGMDVQATFNGPPPPAANYNINLFVNGPGSVSSNPAGLSTGHDHGTNHEYPAGTQITLTASPDSGATFSRWGGACDGSTSSTCVFTVDRGMDVQATFSGPPPPAEPHNVNLAVHGPGSVSSDPGGLSCGHDSGCNHFFDGNTQVTLTASPDPGAIFVGWDQDCGHGDATTCVLTMSNDKNVQAYFALPDTTPPSLSWTGPVPDHGVHPVSWGPVPLQVNASDADSGVARVEFSRWDAVNTRWVDLGEAPSAPYSFTLDSATLNPGWNQVNATAYDKAGNTAGTYIWIDFDTVDPVPTWTSPAANEGIHYVYGESVRLQVDASDNDSGVAGVWFTWWDGARGRNVSLGTVEATPYTVELDTAALNPGWNQVMAMVWDRAWNMAFEYIWLYRIATPGPPTDVRATAGDTIATITWSAPASDGGLPITGYLVFSTENCGFPDARDGPWTVFDSPATTQVMTGLTNGVDYCFQAEAINSAGTSWLSDASVPVTPRTTPSAPTITSVSAGDGKVTVSWTSPDDDGGATIESYTVTAYAAEVAAGAASVGASTTSAAVAGLANGTAYIFTVRATNPAGTGPESPPSGPVTPTAPASPAPPAPPPRSGYWMLGATGSVYAFGDAAYNGAPPGIAAANITPTPTGNGYWIVSKLGDVYTYGDARYLGGSPALRPGELVASMSSTPAGDGYWLFTTHGRVLTYGGARHFGDMAAAQLNGPVLGSVATPSGNGYYMVSSDGGIFSFGDAVFRGSMGAHRLNGRVVGLAPDPDGTGYWLVGEDGGVFSFGADFRGSMGAVRLNKPVIGMVAYGDGYLMVASDGGIFDFSSKPFVGSLGSSPPAAPIIAVAPLNT